MKANKLNPFLTKSAMTLGAFAIIGAVFNPMNVKADENKPKKVHVEKKPAKKTENKKSTSASTKPSVKTPVKPATVVGNASVSEVANIMQSRTGVAASTWYNIIMRESGGNPTIRNSQGYYGLFQLAPGYPGNGGSIQAQIDNAVQLFNNGGLGHWAATAY